MFFNHFLQASSTPTPSPQCSAGTTNIAGPELSCCDVQGPGDVTADVGGTMAVASSYQNNTTYPTVCLYDNRLPTPSSSFRV